MAQQLENLSSLQQVAIPDLWQQEAVAALREGRDVVVQAPTGAGKTFIFELWSKQGKNRGQAIYTVPTRALANDKLAEWRARGWEVGIATGDLSENLSAPVLVATLETQKHRLIRGDGPALLVVDEYQMLGDPDRGLNYELALALAPPSTQLLLLSGSVANPQQVVKWLERLGRQAALIRFERKAREIEARARQAGWEQALWESLFRALGYKQNTWPLQRIAELLPRLQSLPGSVLAWQARLLGVAGLLPSDISRAGSDQYLRGLWDHWWREREDFGDVILPRAPWRFHGLRPANQPQRRLALAAHWLAWRDFPARLEHWFTAEKPEASPSLLACLQAPEDEFWSWHWGLRTPGLARPQPLLGDARATDLAVNVILPWFWIRARAGRNEAMRQTAQARYLAWPAAQDNALLRLARRRLLGRGSSAGIQSAAAQQGLLQIVRDFCDHSNALCADCSFPALVRGLFSAINVA